MEKMLNEGNCKVVYQRYGKKVPCIGTECLSCPLWHCGKKLIPFSITLIVRDRADDDILSPMLQFQSGISATYNVGKMHTDLTVWIEGTLLSVMYDVQSTLSLLDVASVHYVSVLFGNYCKKYNTASDTAVSEIIKERMEGLGVC